LEVRPEIVVEILSTSTRARDLNFKRQIYQEQCVPYYLIFDPDDQQLTALRLDAGKYSEMQFSKTIELQICGDCRLEINVTSFFS
jgi:Uma2 family endonuclease